MPKITPPTKQDFASNGTDCVGKPVAGRSLEQEGDATDKPETSRTSSASVASRSSRTVPPIPTIHSVTVSRFWATEGGGSAGRHGHQSSCRVLPAK